MTRLLWVFAATVLALACEPMAALAARTGAARPVATARAAHASPRPINTKAPAVVLAPGSGYGSLGGSQRVRALQRRLDQAGEAPGPVDGLYGPLTEQAVTRFQAADGLQVDGIAGPQTLAALRAPTVVLYPGTGYQSGGSERVRALQRRLDRAGEVSGPVDGRYGPLTERAVTRFQSAHGLQVDGVAGPQTIAHLQNQVHLQHQPGPKSIPAHSTQHQPSPQSIPAQHRPGSLPIPAQASHPQPAHARAPRNLRRPGRPAGSPLTPWLVVLGVVGLGLLVIAARHTRERRRSRPKQRFIPSREANSNGNDAMALGPDTMTGVLLEGKKDLVGAEAAYRRADEGGDAIAAFNLGVLLERQKQPAEAEQAYRRADQRGHVSAAFNLGVLLEERNDLVGAEAAYRRADERGHGPAASNLGALLEEQNDLAGAEAAYGRADERGEVTGAFNLGVLLEARNDLAGAEAAYRRADKRGHAAAASNLGVLLERQDDVVGAKAAYRRADRRGEATGAFNLGVLLEEQNDPVGAEAAYRRADQRGDADVAKMARAALSTVQREVRRSPRRRVGGGQHAA